MINFLGINIHSSELLPPDFYAIDDWNNPQMTATPEWHTAYIIDEKMFAHPTVIAKITELS